MGRRGGVLDRKQASPWAAELLSVPATAQRRIEMHMRWQEFSLSRSLLVCGGRRRNAIDDGAIGADEVLGSEGFHLSRGHFRQLFGDLVDGAEVAVEEDSVGKRGGAANGNLEVA